ncbi:MAG: hypothetical protein KAT65_21075 [Methanophagales archaeon]|nr:hypothetical protein [Methanophagales archaeon]
MIENKAEEIVNKSNSTRSKKYTGLVIQPYGVKDIAERETDFDEVFNALKPLQTIKSDMPIRLIRADSVSYSYGSLRENVHNLLQTTDFFIADITGNSPNVLYEVGFVTGIGKGEQIIIITQDPSEISVDLRPLLVVRYRTNVLGDLASDIEQHLSRVKRAIDHAEISEQYNKVNKVEAYADRSRVDLDDMFEKAKERIDILQTNLVTVGTNYMNVLINALERNEKLNIRILTLDPQSQYVGVRAMQLGFEDIGVYRNELSAGLDLAKNRFYGFQGRVQIKKYDEFPLQITYVIDNRVVSSVISATGRSRDNYTIILDINQPGVKHSFIDHFEKLWNHPRAKTVLE